MSSYMSIVLLLISLKLYYIVSFSLNQQSSWISSSSSSSVSIASNTRINLQSSWISTSLASNTHITRDIIHSKYIESHNPYKMTSLYALDKDPVDYDKNTNIDGDINENIDSLKATDEYTEEELTEIMALAFDEDHAIELNKKVEAAIEEEYNINEGIIARKPKPIKANIDLWSYQAKQAFLSGNFTKALEFYNRCIDYDKCDGRAWLGIARVYWKKRDYQSSERMYKEGLFYCPNNPYLLQGFAIMLEKLGRSNDAMKCLVTSVKFNPDHAASWFVLIDELISTCLIGLS